MRIKNILIILFLLLIPAGAFAQSDSPVSPELQNQLAQVIKATKDGALQAADFIKEQAPEYVEQLLTFSLVVSLIQFVISLALLAMGVFFTFKLPTIYKYNNEEASYCWSVENAGRFWMIFVMAVVGIIVGLALIDFTWLKILIAPKLFLVEHVKSLIK